ncbi:MAG TPA: PfkB family carbohydrate kinase [Actinomycetes bacterium]|nr:PfkB family carbohydrate kinase [Actinomycetes bacterium]
MILCVCLSPAVDLTYRVDQLVVGSTNRVGTVSSRPGGKAVNVARILRQLGEPVEVLLPLGGPGGGDLARGLADLGVPTSAVHSGAPTRRTVTVVDETSGCVTVLVEPAEIDCWPELLGAFSAALVSARVVVISGVVPSGVPKDAMSTLVELAKAAEVPVVVDTSGPALLDALSAGPTVVKPNAEELALASPIGEPVAAARELSEMHGTVVVASLGPDGVIAAASGRVWAATPATVLEGNATGAGDAVVAGLARALRVDPVATDLRETLRDCVGLASAAVLSPVAGEVDLEVYAAQREGVLVRDLGGVAG